MLKTVTAILRWNVHFIVDARGCLPNAVHKQCPALLTLHEANFISCHVS